MKNIFFKELARDIIALGSIPFFLLVIIRIWLLNNNSYLLQIIISGVLFLILSYFFKANFYAGLAWIVLFFTSKYYTDLRYSFFAILIYLSLLLSLIYLNKEKKKIVFGVLFGIICSLIGLEISKI